MNISHTLTALNQEQREAVCAPLTHLAVIAGAGSGKTRVLVHRIAWLLTDAQISPYQVLAVTFTNKAANEMRGRIEELLGISVRGMWMGTFHGIAHRLLRAHWQQANLPETFQILDADDQYRLIRRVHQTLKLDDDKWEPRQSQWFINAKKDEGLRPNKIDAYSYIDEMLIRIYTVYEELCQLSGLVDFSELLLRSYEVLASNPDLLNHYQERFLHILVDEFQDTNNLQYAWMRLLAGNKAKVMIVGDDDQSIYSWRGAQVENIQRFNLDFLGTKIIRLEQNYRSTQNILTAANAVIANNSNRMGKNLWTDGQTGESLSIYEAFNEQDEARFVVSRIKAWQDLGNDLREVAILYRSNAQSRILEEELLCAGLPYRVYGGQKFFERAEIKDALAYLRLIANRHDDSAFERAVNTPTRGIGNTTIAALRDHARTYSISLWRASQEMVQKELLTARSRNAVASFLQLIESFANDTRGFPLYRQMEHIIHASGLYEHFKKDRSDRAQSRLENLQELIQATQQFHYDNSLQLTPLQAFLSYVALESGEGQADLSEDYVQLMTLHSAKGLEFELVFITGLEEGLFPHKMSLEDSERLAEERRLCYVGMTRAKQKLYLSYAESRRLNGSEVRHFPSRFIHEIPESLRDEIRFRVKVFRPVTPTLSSSLPTPDDLGYQLGQRVNHPKFGEGIILNYEGHGPQARIQVKFASVGVKWLVAEYARLEAG